MKHCLSGLKLSRNALYDINIVVKFDDKYKPSNENRIYLFQNEDNKIYFVEEKIGVFHVKYKLVNDYWIFGFHNKKIMIQETNKKLLHLQYNCQFKEELANQFTDNVFLISDEKIDITNYNNEKLTNKYNYEIQNIHEKQEHHIYNYEIQVLIHRRKTLIERIKEKIGLK